MTNNNSPVTRTSLDPIVVYVLFAFMFVFLGVLAFRVFTGEDCNKVGFVVVSDGFRAGEVITLKDTTFGAKSWEWNFGDNTPVSQIKAPVHVYEKPGKYELKLTVNGSCEKLLTLNILPKKQVVVDVDDALKLPVITSPKRIYLGEPAMFSADSTNGKTFEWNFGETERTDASGKQVSYTFSGAGQKNVTVYVNGLANVVTKKVNVQKRPDGGPAPTPEPVPAPAPQNTEPLPKGVKAPLISDEDFTKLLNEIAKGKTQLNDLLTYSCGKSDIVVTVNNAEKQNLAEFFNYLKSNNKIVVKRARLRTNANYCILDIEVDTKKRLM